MKKMFFFGISFLLSLAILISIFTESAELRPEVASLEELSKRRVKTDHRPETSPFFESNLETFDDTELRFISEQKKSVLDCNEFEEQLFKFDGLEEKSEILLKHMLSYYKSERAQCMSDFTIPDGPCDKDLNVLASSFVLVSKISLCSGEKKAENVLSTLSELKKAFENKWPSFLRAVVFEDMVYRLFKDLIHRNKTGMNIPNPEEDFFLSQQYLSRSIWSENISGVHLFTEKAVHKYLNQIGFGGKEILIFLGIDYLYYDRRDSLNHNYDAFQTYELAISKYFENSDQKQLEEAMLEDSHSYVTKFPYTNIAGRLLFYLGRPDYAPYFIRIKKRRDEILSKFNNSRTVASEL